MYGFIEKLDIRTEQNNDTMFCGVCKSTRVYGGYLDTQKAMKGVA